MIRDISRLALVILFCILVGILAGHVVVCLIAGLLLYNIWQFRVNQQVVIWLRRRREEEPPVLAAGVTDAICQEVEYLKARHKHRKKKLAGHLKRFQEATAALPDAVLILGNAGEIEWANNKAKQHLGVNWPQDKGQRISNLIRFPDFIDYLEDKPAPDQGIQLPAPTNYAKKLEYRLSPYGDTQQLMIVRDITEIDRVNQARKDFIANASHELRTPLTVLLGYLERFSNDKDCLEKWRTPVKQMYQQTERMQRLIEDLLRLSYLESTSDQATHEVMIMPKLLQDIRQEAQALSGDSGHILQLEHDAELWLKGNKQALYGAFTNLVFNAVQHTPMRSRINIRWYEDEHGAHFEVSDNGPGIARVHLPYLTERFYRVDSSRSRDTGGTGLGLAIVKHALLRHGGDLHITSQPGKGSQFRCDLPAANIVHSAQNTGR